MLDTVHDIGLWQFKVPPCPPGLQDAGQQEGQRGKIRCAQLSRQLLCRVAFWHGMLAILVCCFSDHLLAQATPNPTELLSPARNWAYPPSTAVLDEPIEHNLQRTPAILARAARQRVSFLPDQQVAEPPDTRQPAGPSYHIEALVRSYYKNDQRFNFTGQTSLFGVEGDIHGQVRDQVGEWNVWLDVSLFLHQPFDGNLLVDSPVRESFRANFEFDVFELDNLTVNCRRGDLQMSLGKMPTPFGRYYFQRCTNERWDSPFIRSESILWKETGFLIQLDPGNLDIAAAVTNGGPERDGNSSKAFIGRVGIETDNFVLGGSVKWQDGIGSENQKTFNNHVGLDTMFRWKKWVVSGEVIYDEYGMRRPGFDLVDITWGRSLYNRELNSGAFEVPITGVGYYVNISRQLEDWHFSLNYGEFYPDQIGDAIHDVTTRRGLIRATRSLSSSISIYGLALFENDILVDQADRYRKGWAILTGIRWDL